MSRYINADYILDGIKNDRALIQDGKMDKYKEHYLSFLERCVEHTPSIDLDDYVPKDFHDKTCEAMAKRHQEEIADMVSVVRCKECKYLYNDADTGKACEFTNLGMQPDDFCSYGERSRG